MEFVLNQWLNGKVFRICTIRIRPNTFCLILIVYSILKCLMIKKDHYQRSDFVCISELTFFFYYYYFIFSDFGLGGVIENGGRSRQMQ